jgi:hypothetical protein
VNHKHDAACFAWKTMPASLLDEFIEKKENLLVFFHCISYHGRVDIFTAVAGTYKAYAISWETSRYCLLHVPMEYMKMGERYISGHNGLLPGQVSPV